MKKSKKTICFDLDNVICKTNNENDYYKSKPNKRAINKINKLNKKYIIIIFTARGMGRFNGNIEKVKKNLYPLTKRQLKIWGVRYKKLIMGKPSYDFIVDDKSYNYDNKWITKIEQQIKNKY